MIACKCAIQAIFGFLLAFLPLSVGNIWTSMPIPPHIPCSLPLCDPLCIDLEITIGQICPRTASSNFKVSGIIPGNASCTKEAKNWIPGPKISQSDPDGCGPCLLPQEKSVCTTKGLGGRGFNAGGPIARRGHTMLTYTTPIRSRYIGATVLIVFGGIDRDNKFLNDVWFRCVDKCPPVSVGLISYDKYGVGTSFPYCSPGNCDWEEVNILQDFRQWFEQKDLKTSSMLRRGIVPARPAGRVGHTAVIAQVESVDGSGLKDIMTVYGGISPNCTDYCADIWNYDIMGNWWVINYGEWWGVDNNWQRMWDYNVFNVTIPRKRWGHIAVMAGDYMFVWGGHTNGSSAACCGYDYELCNQPNRLLNIYPSSVCSYLSDLWVVNLKTYVPYEVLQSLGKHATQSSTIGTGVARLAVDGNTNPVYSNTWNTSVTMTNADPQAWWQVDLGGATYISSIKIFNRQDRFSERLSNFYVLVSLDPLLSDRLQDILEDPEVHKIHIKSVDGSIVVYPAVYAQYVRIQLAGTNYLSLAEVQVWGYDPIQEWQHMEGIKRWTHLPASDAGYPYGRLGATATMISNKTVLMYGGFVKENPFFLDDFWTAMLPSKNFLEFENPVIWTQISPILQQPMNIQPTARYAHTASYSDVCSLGAAIEQSVMDGSLVLDSLDQGVLPTSVYPGSPTATDWCRGQVIFYGGGTAALRKSTFIGYPDGLLPDMWIYNVSSSVISQFKYDITLPYPSSRREHATAIHADKLYLFGGASSQCEGGICGDFWYLNVSGPYSCPNLCSDHGVCEWGFCICDSGFKEIDCSGVACPKSACAYSYEHHRLECVECSGRGFCNRNGTCACNAGYKGEACEVLSCPGECSGHGTCKLGGVCDCDADFGGADCFVAYCPKNCTTWNNGYDSGTQGDCVVVRSPPCCGIEPNCVKIATSPNPCTERNSDYVPPHNVSATCVCSDTYDGADCGSTIADRIIKENQALSSSSAKTGCFSRDALVIVPSTKNQVSWKPLSDFKVGDKVIGFNQDGEIAETSVVFIHDHVNPAATIVLHLNDSSYIELTGKHSVPVLVDCHPCSKPLLVDISAANLVRGSLLLKANLYSNNTKLSWKVVSLLRVSERTQMVRYILTESNNMLVNGVASSTFSTRAGWLETLPFRILYSISPWIITNKAVGTVLWQVMESPFLSQIEDCIDYSLSSMFPQT